jgi:hypothetical protein
MANEKAAVARLWREILLLKRHLAGFIEGSGGGGFNQLTGDVTAGPGTGSQASTIANDAVTNAKLANMAEERIKGRAVGAGTGDPTDLTPDQVSTILDEATDPFLRTSAAGGGETRVVIYELDGGGTALTGSFTRYVRVPFTGTITKWTLLADASGSIVIDVWKDTFANFPPDNADSITAGNEPELSTDNEAEDSTLTGWGTSVTAGDVFGFTVDSVSGLLWVSLTLEITT